MRNFLMIIMVAGQIVLLQSQEVPEGCFPSEYLPEHISPLTSFGQRAEWSRDGRYVFFVDSAGGDVWRVEIDNLHLRRITQSEHRPEGHGYYRVLCLANGDLLLTCGPERYKLYMQVMSGDLEEMPKQIAKESINEGPAISRRSMRIAWSPDHKQIYSGVIRFQEGEPVIEEKQLIVDNRHVVIGGVRYEDILEPQDFRPPDDHELIWSQYGRTSRNIFSSEVMGYEMSTGKLVNYSRAPEQYDEPEGIFPDGLHTLIESDKHHPEGTAFLDIYKFTLDSINATYERLTYFSEIEGFRSSNPVISPDATKMVFQASIAGSAAGAGCGLYLYDFKKANGDR